MTVHDRTRLIGQLHLFIIAGSPTGAMRGHTICVLYNRLYPRSSLHPVFFLNFRDTQPFVTNRFSLLVQSVIY
jgi:hypothetical protein